MMTHAGLPSILPPPRPPLILRSVLFTHPPLLLVHPSSAQVYYAVDSLAPDRGVELGRESARGPPALAADLTLGKHRYTPATRTSDITCLLDPPYTKSAPQLVVGQLRVPADLECPQHHCPHPTLPTHITILPLRLSLMRRNPSSPNHRQRIRLTLSQRTSDLASRSVEAGGPESKPRHQSPQPPSSLGYPLPCHITLRSVTNTRKFPTSTRMMRLSRSRIGRTFPSPFVISFIT